MSCGWGSRLSIALVHFPVLNKEARTVTTAVTNLDVHDIARSARTYGIADLFIVTPVAAQREMVARIVSHWREGWGAGYNPRRKEALGLLRVASSLDEAAGEIARRTGTKPKVIATGARLKERLTTFELMRELLAGGNDHYLLLLGTGWGLAEEVIAGADLLLEPIAGGSDYNHLSVRSAAAIMLDRLLGRR